MLRDDLLVATSMQSRAMEKRIPLIVDLRLDFASSDTNCSHITTSRAIGQGGRATRITHNTETIACLSSWQLKVFKKIFI